MLWSLFCFGGYSMASRDSGIKKYFLFRFGARHYEKTVPISVINSVMQMNGFPPRAARLCNGETMKKKKLPAKKQKSKARPKFRKVKGPEDLPMPPLTPATET